MIVVELAQALMNGASAIPMDDKTVSMLAMFVGVAGGVFVTGYLSQMKAKKVKVDRKPRELPRKPE
jgi:hypothetical protein